MIEVESGDMGGNRYRVANKISVERNYAGPIPDTGNAYYIETNTGYVSLTREEMLEFFAAFLAVKGEYND